MYSGTFNDGGCHDLQQHNCEQVKNNCFTQPLLAIDKNCIPPEPKPPESMIAFSSGRYPFIMTFGNFKKMKFIK
ncbi:hypothetical protein [Lysinibacillus xylanilyticus]|uniref:hypothetical protein n=1 Tax=Lysinibacillus xylanilyticus TaxID=582475 RepID=UPI003D03E7ED